MPEQAVPAGSLPPPLLTMLTVCIRKHHDDLRQHIALMDRLNPGVPWRLIVVDNSASEPDRFSCEDPRVEVRHGVALDVSKPLDARFSYHHASALNANLGDVSSRYLLVLDPDLFVVYPNWMRDAIEHMRERALCFFGTPWHPRWYTKYRYFPAVHFILIDLQRVPVSELDFRPDLIEYPSWSRRHQAILAEHDRPNEKTPGERFRRACWAILNGVYRSGYFFLSRQLIGSSRDTGWKIWSKFATRCPADCVLPVVDLEKEFTAPAFLTTRLGRAADALFPTRLRFLPTAGSYVSADRAAACGVPDLGALQAEAFVWRNRPFAFHRRGMQQAASGATGPSPRDWTEMLNSYCEPEQGPRIVPTHGAPCLER